MHAKEQYLRHTLLIVKPYHCTSIPQGEDCNDQNEYISLSGKFCAWLCFIEYTLSQRWRAKRYITVGISSVEYILSRCVLVYAEYLRMQVKIP